MTIDETKKLMRRIKSNYSEFVLDDFNIQEWHRELKNYDYEDVEEKLEQHFRNEEFGNRPPKVYFLTKYIKTTEMKQNTPKYTVYCNLCGEVIDYEDYDKHYKRCSAIHYIQRKAKQIFDKDVNIELYYRMNEEDFMKIYNTFLNKIVDKLEGIERKLVLKILYPNLSDESINEMLKDFLKNSV